MSPPKLKMPSRSLCLVCGASDSEVAKMHHFPVNLERSRMWQESMGIKFTGDSLEHFKICSRHFEQYFYLNGRLSTKAVPTLFSAASTSRENDPNICNVANISVRSCEEAVPLQAVVEEEVHTPPNQVGKLFKGIPNLSRGKSSPRKELLMNIVIKKEDQLRKLKKLCKQRGADIKSLSDLSDETLVKQMFHGMSQTTADFLASQIRCAVKEPKARRWSIDEKVVALSIMKRSPKCYAFMRKLLALPSRSTLLELLRQVPFDVGRNVHVCEHMNNTLGVGNERMCVLLFDEIDIKQNIYYDPKRDQMVGFENFGDATSSTKPANKALIFMCQGIIRNWKQPVAYYFSNECTSGEKLATLIQDVTKTLLEVARVNVLATICDMGTNNVKALNILGSRLDRPFVMVGQKQIFTIFDVPHLLKRTVALFRKYEVEVPVEVGGETQVMAARFGDIVEAHKIDNASPLVFQSLHKIKSHHLNPIMQHAMKVSIAAQVMSRTVSCFLWTLISRGELEARAIATATFITQVDELFDSFNGSQMEPGAKPLKCAITNDSQHIEYWKKAQKMVKAWKFRRITKRGNLRKGMPPSQLGWLTTIKSIMAVWRHVSALGVTSLKPRHLNQDPLENLNGCIREGCGSGDNPTVTQFVGSLKTQMLNGLTKTSRNTNCEEDMHSLLMNLKNFLTTPVGSSRNAPMLREERTPTTTTALMDDIFAANMVNVQGILSVAYVAGSIIKYLKQHKLLDCESCLQQLITTNVEQHNMFISYKELKDSEKHLIYPSEPFVIFVGTCVTQLENFIPTFGGRHRIREVATETIVRNIGHLCPSCDEHKDLCQTLVNSVCRIGLSWWAKRQNEHLKTAREQKRKLRKFRHN